jgi:hypothetical protein
VGQRLSQDLGAHVHVRQFGHRSPSPILGSGLGGGALLQEAARAAKRHRSGAHAKRARGVRRQ